MRLAAALCLLPMTASAEQSVDALYTVMAEHDCRVAQSDVAGIFGPRGFTPDFVKETLTGLLVDGTATEDAKGTLSLPVSLCPPDQPAPSPRAALLGSLTDDDCTLTRDRLAEIREEIGVTEAQLRAILIPLYENGQAEIGLSSARLDSGLCAADETE